jgi:hypothetical protein
VVLARIEIAASPTHPTCESVVDEVATWQRFQLLDKQRKQDGEKAHVPG